MPDVLSAEPTTAAAALASRRFLATRWPWRALLHVLSSSFVVALAAVPLLLALIPIVALRSPLERGAMGPVVAGVLAAAVLLGGFVLVVAPAVAWLERARLQLVDPRPVAMPGPRTWPQRWTDPLVWRECGYAVVLAVAGSAVGAVLVGLVTAELATLALPLLADGTTAQYLAWEIRTPADALPFTLVAALLLPLLPYAWTAAAAAHGALVRAMLVPDDEVLAAELVEVTRSRARLVDAFEAERRRIERDLHDGTQQRLLGMTMQLGVAQLDTDPRSPAGIALADAHRQAKDLMTHLRELIRGIHPPVLTDHGLPAAVAELADRSTVPVEVTADLPRRLPPGIESAAYFVVAEALTNVAKHSGATRAEVTLRQHGRTLVVEIRDDGRGGARPGAGTGLTGLADRVAVAGGRVLLTSPDGGPTVLRVELPCPA
ncbi:histidine kinase [Pseudonocardia sp. CA-107938]|uniref:sensor histidine kinase n=1 Tax=Pseudonocardia sp. CA-107938 TaxID=3240021 RepID=UPI003D8FC70E